MAKTLVLRTAATIIEIDGYFDSKNYLGIDINTGNGFDSIWITTQQAKEIIEHLTTCLKEHEEANKKNG